MTQKLKIGDKILYPTNDFILLETPSTLLDGVTETNKARVVRYHEVVNFLIRGLYEIMVLKNCETGERVEVMIPFGIKEEECQN